MNHSTDFTTKSHLPRVTSYGEIFEFFNDYLVYRKKLDDQFSLELWALELGFQSRSYIYMLIKGKKKISSQFLDSFSRALNLEQREMQHLVALSQYHNSKTSTLKTVFKEKILESLEDPPHVTRIHNQAEFFSYPEIPALQLLLAFKDFKSTEANISYVLNLSLPEVKQLLNVVEEIGLVRSSAADDSHEKTWRAITKSFVAQASSDDQPLASFHASTLDEAKTKLNSKKNMTKFKSVYFSLAPDSYGSFADDVDRFVKKMKLKYESATLDQKQIFKLNVQAYPVTLKYEAQDSSAETPSLS